MSRLRPVGWLDWTFAVGLVLKGIDGVLELIGGALLLLLHRSTLESWVVALTQRELSEDPSDFLATRLLDEAQHLSVASQSFAALYLLAHGLVKVVLVVAVIRNKLWAYPWMIGFLLIFIAYQVYRFALQPTWTMAALTLFDAFIVWLTRAEYGKQRAKSG